MRCIGSDDRSHSGWLRPHTLCLCRLPLWVITGLVYSIAFLGFSFCSLGEIYIHRYIYISRHIYQANNNIKTGHQSLVVTYGYIPSAYPPTWQHYRYRRMYNIRRNCRIGLDRPRRCRWSSSALLVWLFGGRWRCRGECRAREWEWGLWWWNAFLGGGLDLDLVGVEIGVWGLVGWLGCSVLRAV